MLDGRIKHIHLIGVAGAAMAPVAGMLKERGFHVSGSDRNVYPPASTLLDSLGIVWNDGYRPENLQPAPDLVVVGNVVARGNPEVVASVWVDGGGKRGLKSCLNKG